MKKRIIEFCENQELKNGLMLINMPTGTGKTHHVVDYMAENYEKIADAGGRMFFVTTLKKNLPFEKLEKKFIDLFGEENGRSKYNREVLKLESNWES